MVIVSGHDLWLINRRRLTALSQQTAGSHFVATAGSESILTSQFRISWLVLWTIDYFRIMNAFGFTTSWTNDISWSMFSTLQRLSTS